MAARKVNVTDVTTDSTTDAATVAVTVEKPYQARYDGTVYPAGETVSVDVDTAEQWERAGFVRRA